MRSARSLCANPRGCDEFHRRNNVRYRPAMVMVFPKGLLRSYSSCSYGYCCWPSAQGYMRKHRDNNSNHARACLVHHTWFQHLLNILASRTVYCRNHEQLAKAYKLQANLMCRRSTFTCESRPHSLNPRTFRYMDRSPHQLSVSFISGGRRDHGDEVTELPQVGGAS